MRMAARQACGPKVPPALAPIRDAEEADAFPNVAAMLYPLANTGSESSEGGEQAGPGEDVDDPAMFVSIVRALGFAMSLDVAEIANTVNAEPVTVLDVVATTSSDGGALQKLAGFAEQLQKLPDAPTFEAAALSVRQILDNAANDLRAMGIDDLDAKNRSSASPQDAHTFAEAIRQLVDGVKALMNQTSHIGGGLTKALTSFISPDGHTARYLVQTKLNPFATGAMNQIRRIVDAARGAHPGATLADASISVSGITAMLRDMRAYFGEDIQLIIAMTILIVFLILVALLRAVVAPLYLIASVVISYLSALGVGVIVFQFVFGQNLTWSIPGLTFIVLVAMGADYNLLLISRLREESPIRRALRGYPHGGLDGWCDHCGGCHFRRLDVRDVVRQHQHPGAGGFHCRDRASAGYFPGAHHHRARHGGAGRKCELVAIAATAALAAATRTVTHARSRINARRAAGHCGRSGCGPPLEAGRGRSRHRFRHRRAPLVSWRDSKTHSATRRGVVGARP